MTQPIHQAGSASLIATFFNNLPNQQPRWPGASLCRVIATFVLIQLAPSAGMAQNLSGAGSTFAAPMYAAVAEKLGTKHQFKINYASVGSGEGVRRMQEKSVDFGASDRPLSRSELSSRGLLQFPTAIGGIVITANLPGLNISQLKLDGLVLAEIYSGKITRWDDAKIAALNSGVALPKTSIKVIIREEGSGSTYLFSSYLSKTSSNWKDAQGLTNTIILPGAISAKGNGGVAQTVAAQPNSIGYLEYGYATDNKLPSVQMKNAVGNFVSANATGIEAAVRAADWELLYIDTNPSFDINTVNVACSVCWPITGLTYLLVPRKWQDSEKASSFTRFLEGLLSDGDAVLKEENYVPLPSRAKNLIRVTIRAKMQDGKGNRISSELDHHMRGSLQMFALLHTRRSQPGAV